MVLINYIRKFAKDNNLHLWTLHTNRFPKNKDILRWQCNNKHIFEKSYYNVKCLLKNSNETCLQCKREKRNNVFLNKYKQMAVHKDGLCISNQYINSREKLTMKCQNNHIFEITPTELRQGRWCKICGPYLNLFTL